MRNDLMSRRQLLRTGGVLGGLAVVASGRPQRLAALASGQPQGAAPVIQAPGQAADATFSGRVEGDRMSGTLDMGEYLGATWTAARD